MLPKYVTSGMSLNLSGGYIPQSLHIYNGDTDGIFIIDML